jgi:Mrp family chromosome partitioning ATPase
LAAGRIELNESMFHGQWDGFTVVPCGGSAIDVGEMLAGEKFRQLMRDFADRFDVVIVDAPPITNLSDASLFTQNISNVVVVAAASNTRRAELVRIASSLRHAGAKILGVVLTKVRKDEHSAPADEEGRKEDGTRDR